MDHPKREQQECQGLCHPDGACRCRHDLRRTARSHLGALGVDVIIAEKCLNHTLGGLIDVYDRGDYLPERRKALELCASFLLACDLGKPRRKGRRVGHQGDEAMQQLIGDLNGVWIDYWECLPGASHERTTGDIGGPCIRFVRAFLQCIERRVTDEDLRADPGLRVALRPSPEAIRERLQATGVSRLASGGKSSPHKN